jgi:hypothetical protein
MDFRLTPEQEAFQSELRAWLDRNAVEVFGDYGAPQLADMRLCYFYQFTDSTRVRITADVNQPYGRPLKTDIERSLTPPRLRFRGGLSILSTSSPCGKAPAPSLSTAHTAHRTTTRDSTEWRGGGLHIR